LSLIFKTEKAHHELEKKKLGDKLNSEMKKKMEEQRESASHRENLLQKEIKNWQVKYAYQLNKNVSSFVEKQGFLWSPHSLHLVVMQPFSSLGDKNCAITIAYKNKTIGKSSCSPILH